MDLQPRWEEAKRIGAPDLWHDIEGRATMPQPRGARERLVAAAVASVIAIAGGFLLVQAVRSGDSPTQPGTGVIPQPPASPSVADDACSYPAVQPTTLPWLNAGDVVPTPLRDNLHQKLLWEGPEGVWSGSYVSLRILEDHKIEGEEAAPALPDGTSGTLLEFNREWYVLWSPSDRYCGSIALYVYLKGLTSSESKAQALEIAGSLTERTDPVETP